MSQLDTDTRLVPPTPESVAAFRRDFREPRHAATESIPLVAAARHRHRRRQRLGPVGAGVAAVVSRPVPVVPRRRPWWRRVFRRG